jgi:hypothetical protein
MILSTEQAMNRGLNIANGLQKKLTTSCFCIAETPRFCLPILNQNAGVSVSFIFRGRYSGHRLRRVPLASIDLAMAHPILVRLCEHRLFAHGIGPQSFTRRSCHTPRLFGRCRAHC